MTPNIAKCFRAKFFGTGFLMLSGLAASAVYGQGTAFKDSNLEATIRKFLPDAKPGEPLTDARLAQLAIVSSTMPIGDIAGLEKCKKLTFLFITGPVSDLAPLAQLTNLQTITIKGGKIRDLKPLAGLSNLEYLDLSDNQIADLGPLAGLTKLKTLHVSNNQIKDLTPLASLTALETVHLDGNQIADLKPLGGLKALATVDVRKNQVADVGPLAGLPAWRYLYLDQNKVSDLASLVNGARQGGERAEGLGMARIVSVAGNPLSAAAKAQQVPELRKLLFDVVVDK
ncbi:MAG TPA: leucine-rich repeat protein [Bryobacteraceae bacterium]|nr:leucine-rich repeat protein [Bryobacteraceae bacterium]